MSYDQERTTRFGWGAAAFAVVGALVATSVVADGIAIVHPRERAIAVTFGHKSNVMHEGVNFVLPLFNSVSRFDLALSVSDNASVQLKTKDAQTVYLDVTSHFCLTDACTRLQKSGANIETADERIQTDKEIDQQFYTFKSTKYEDVYKNFLLEAATDAVGKRSITDIAPNISAIAQEINEGLTKKLSAAGYNSLIVKDVLLRKFHMETASETFANNVAMDMQRTTQIAIQATNLEAQKKNATAQGVVIGNEVNQLATTAGIPKELAAQLVLARMEIDKWSGTSAIPPSIPGLPLPPAILAQSPAAIAPPAPAR